MQVFRIARQSRAFRFVRGACAAHPGRGKKKIRKLAPGGALGLLAQARVCRDRIESAVSNASRGDVFVQPRGVRVNKHLAGKRSHEITRRRKRMPARQRMR